MKVRICVHAIGEQWEGGAAIIVPEPMEYAFEPLKTTDNLMMAINGDEAMAESSIVNKKMVMRKNAAKFLSEAIAGQLLKKMQKDDTHNGYKKVNNLTKGD